MSTLLTEKWSMRTGRFDAKLRAWAHTRVYEVNNCPDEFTARSLLGIKLNDPHELNTHLRCTSIDPKQTGFRFWQIPVVWTIPCGGDATSNDDPLSQPIEIEWEPGVWSEASEIDATGKPILNMAGDPVDAQPIDYPTMTLVVYKWVPFYDPVQSVNYLGAINSDTFTVAAQPQAIIVPPGQCRCSGIRPEGRYTLNSVFVEEVSRFVFRPNNTPVSNVQADAWDLRILNQGYNGWFTDPATSKPAKGKFFRNGTEATSPVLLDASGIPIEKGITVSFAQKTAIANPNPPVAGTDVFLETQNIGGVKQVFLHYNRGKRLPFSSLV